MKKGLLFASILALISRSSVNGFVRVSPGAATVLTFTPAGQAPDTRVRRIAFSPKRAGKLIRLPMAEDDSVSF